MKSDYTQQFIDLAIRNNTLKFGNFTLKSGRQSPYFFNMGSLNDGEALCSLGEFYAEKISTLPQRPDVIFGPAYKGIPLATTSIISLYAHHKMNLAYCFNRKEKKDHGEGGALVGANIRGKKVVIVDDVITAGTAIREAIELIAQQGGQLVGIVIALDRQERGQHEQSAIQEIQQQQRIPVTSIITLNDIIQYVANQHPELLKPMMEYRERYGV